MAIIDFEGLTRTETVVQGGQSYAGFTWHGITQVTSAGYSGIATAGRAVHSPDTVGILGVPYKAVLVNHGGFDLLGGFFTADFAQGSTFVVKGIDASGVVTHQRYHVGPARTEFDFGTLFHDVGKAVIRTTTDRLFMDDLHVEFTPHPTAAGLDWPLV